MEIWIGAYPAGGLGSPTGTGEGMWAATLTAGGGIVDAGQVSVQPAPSFVLVHPTAPVVYAVEETSPTVVTAFDTTRGETVGRIVVGGDYGCHLSLAPAADALYVANYGTGELAVIALGAGGLFAADEPSQVHAHAGSGPRADRQEGPHAHFSVVGPGGSHLLVADLGTDQLRAHRIGEGGLLGEAAIAATLPPGSGPRHLAVHEELIYVVCELDHTLRTLRWDRHSATAELIAEQPTTLVPHRSGEDVFDAHVELAPNGRGGALLLVSVRGADVISVFDIAPEGELTYRCAFDSGQWPRHFAVLGEYVVVAASRDHELRSFALADVQSLAPESESGAVAALPFASASVQSPASIAGRSALA